jgi:hypothetical protein
MDAQIHQNHAQIYLNNIVLFEIDDNESEEAVRYKTLKLDQVKLNIS